MRRQARIPFTPQKELKSPDSTMGMDCGTTLSLCDEDHLREPNQQTPAKTQPITINDILDMIKPKLVEIVRKPRHLTMQLR